MNSRSQSLDILRGIAILLVLSVHFPFVRWIALYGGAGVTLFFVMSGYLISGLLFAEYKRTGTLRIGRFLLRRGFKIWPSFYVYVLFSSFLLRYVHDPSPYYTLGVSATFLSNYYLSGSAGILGHTWSIAVEEHFYLTLPLVLLLLMSRKKLHWLPALCLLSMIACATFRFLNAEGVHFKTHTRFDSLLIGVTLGYFSHFRPEWLQRIGRSRNLLLAIPCILTWNISPALSLALVHVGFAIVLAWAVQREPQRFVKAALWPLSQLGIYSYCIYLWQQPFAAMVYSPRLQHFPVLLAATCAAVAVGVCMSHLIEQPMLALRESWCPSTSRAALVQESSQFRLCPSAAGNGC